MDIKLFQVINDNWNASPRRPDERMVRRINEFERIICNVENKAGAIFYTMCEGYIVQKE
jgi:hypothetical protein